MSTIISTFDVYCVASNTLTSNALYANGRHQLKIGIKITKQVNGVNTALTEAEKRSIYIVGYGSGSIPSGWIFSTIDNGYSHGLRTSSLTESRSVTPLGGAEESPQQISFPEVFYRFLSCSDSTLQPQSLVARVMLDTGDYVNTGESRYNKVLAITPTKPYIISSSELVRSDEEVYWDPMGKNEHYQVRVTYWALPYSLYIKQQTSSGGGLNATGRVVEYSPKGKNPVRCVQALDPGPTSFPANRFINTNGNPPGTAPVSVPHSNRNIRASCAEMSGYKYDGEYLVNPCTVTIVDDYGCEYRFIIYAKDNVYNAEIRNA